MRHQVSGRKFGRNASHRRAMLRSMATSLLRYEKFKTTVHKAKDLRRIVDKLITLGKRGTLHARRQAYAYVLDKRVVHKLFDDLGPRFQSRKGGYTRVIRADFRHGDAAEMAYIELTEAPKPGSAKPGVLEPKKKSDKKPAKKAAASTEKVEKKSKTKAAPKRAKKSTTKKS